MNRSPAPDALAILPHFTNAVIGHVMKPAFLIHQAKGPRGFFQEFNRFQRDGDDPSLNPVEIAQFKVAVGKFLVPANSIQKILNGRHGGLSIQCRTYGATRHQSIARCKIPRFCFNQHSAFR
jgi:hypothetical protein